ncbi:Ribose operon transcriptional regulator, LacI family [Pediococcus claussenii ATCC BAA-344]|uniref:Ribose operon transcriptional regulator, LacI family n=2 Tax=Pediococcus claussenii TaxID=187452 RepID=G8PEZ0_PEDCP|nr:Ribose operon transcriptional regulator, LacI family [Pediococcus claussenii ATCC BAA-344]KRN20098.1 hypothetical protein IV79_GL000763 [Pediococcus claussenii]
MMTKKITIREVAVQAGVSVTTVSQILNNKGKRFSAETRKKVRDAQNQLGYVPDFSAQNMVTKQSKTIGVLVPEIGNPFFSNLIQGIQSELALRGYALLIFDFENQVVIAEKYLAELVRRAADGMIIASDIIDRKNIDHILNANNVPYIMLDQNPLNTGDQVIIDDFEGGRMAAKHFIDKGHQKLAMLLPDEAPQNIEKRWNGFNTYVNEKALSSKRFTAELSKNGGRTMAKDLLKEHITGVFAANDEVAIGLYRGVKEAGMKIPNDISIIGYDDIDLDQYITPSLTTIHQPVFEMGGKAAQFLIERVVDPSSRIKKLTLPINLIPRESVKSLKS